MKYNLEKINKELELSQIAKEQGNDGKSRVCARRAVSFAIQEKLISVGKTYSSPNLQTLSSEILEEFDISENLQTIVANMSLKVEMKKDTRAYFWPYPDIDLLEDAKLFVKELLGD